MERHLVLFAKRAVLGRVKSRLAEEIGFVEATRLYRRLFAEITRALANDPRWRTWLAVTPDTAVSDKGVWPSPVRLVGQGGGDLGTRMGRIFRNLPPGPVVIVGTDIPCVKPAMIDRAFRTLGDCDFVFGPAEDGGYWLVGARRRPRITIPFDSVRWSGRHALADTLQNLPDDVTVGFVDTLYDIDAPRDYRRWRKEERSRSARVEH